MSKWVLRLLEIQGAALATGRENLAAKAAVEIVQGRGEQMLGNYLQSFDVEAYDGRGDATFTPHISEALKFDSVSDAMECWRKQSQTRPLRPDGKPNRPLTAFNVSPERISE
jgi:hypothetical protein